MCSTGRRETRGRARSTGLRCRSRGLSLGSLEARFEVALTRDERRYGLFDGGADDRPHLFPHGRPEVARLRRRRRCSRRRGSVRDSRARLRAADGEWQRWGRDARRRRIRGAHRSRRGGGRGHRRRGRGSCRRRRSRCGRRRRSGLDGRQHARSRLGKLRRLGEARHRIGVFPAVALGLVFPASVLRLLLHLRATCARLSNARLRRRTRSGRRRYGGRARRPDARSSISRTRTRTRTRNGRSGARRRRCSRSLRPHRRRHAPRVSGLAHVSSVSHSRFARHGRRRRNLGRATSGRVSRVRTPAPGAIRTVRGSSQGRA